MGMGMNHWEWEGMGLTGLKKTFLLISSMSTQTHTVADLEEQIGGSKGSKFRRASRHSLLALEIILLVPVINRNWAIIL